MATSRAVHRTETAGRRRVALRSRLRIARRQRPAWTGLALLVAGAFFMENLDGTIIATAAPRMARTFAIPSVELNVVITAYLLALGVFIPVSGWLADRFGARVVFSAAVTVFTLASGLCALSAGLGELTAARVLQGIGGAMMVPVGRLVVLRAAGRADLIRVVAYLTWPALVAPVLAPVLGGALVTYASWRWIFVLNLPLGVIALLIALRIVPDLRPERPGRLDWRGFALTGAGLGAFVYGLELVTYDRISWVVVGLACGAGILLLLWALAHLRASTRPLLDLGVLRLADVSGCEPRRVPVPVGYQRGPLPPPPHVPGRFRLESFQGGDARASRCSQATSPSSRSPPRCCTASASGRSCDLSHGWRPHPGLSAPVSRPARRSC